MLVSVLVRVSVSSDSLVVMCYHFSATSNSCQNTPFLGEKRSHCFLCDLFVHRAEVHRLYISH